MSEEKISSLSSQVIVADAFEYLPQQRFDNVTSIVTSLPDESELSESVLQKYNGYESFLRQSTRLILKSLSPYSYAIFMQTDRKKNGHWIDKASIITHEAHKQQWHTIFHKIILTTGLDKINLYRPTYTHMLCFSVKGKCGKASPNVFVGGKSLF